MRKYSTKYWSVNVPTLWDAEFSDGADVIYDNKGVGELIISTLYDEQGVSDEQLEAMAAEHLNSSVELEDIDIGDFSGICVSYSKDSEYWCEWYLRTSNILLFASYNCDEENAEEDEDVVESILESIELLN